MVLVYDNDLFFMTHFLIVIYNCMKFHSNSFCSFQVKAQTWNSIANDQREITTKICKAELWFLCMTCHLNVLYKYMKFHQIIFNGYKLTRFCKEIALHMIKGK